MALFDELRQQMSAKYGKKKKKEEEPLLPVAGDSSSAGAKTSFDSMRKNLSKKYNPAADVDTDYIDSFLRDSSDFLKSAETDYNSMTPDTSSQIYASRHKASEDLNKRRTAIKSFLEQNRDRLDPKAYGDLAKYLDDFAGASGQLGYVFYDANRQLNYDNPDNRLRLYNTMQDRLKTIETEMKTASNGDLISLTDEKKKLEDSVRQYERTQYKADSYNDIYKKKGFGSISSNRNFNTPSRDEFNENDVRLDSGSWYYDAGGKLYNALGEAVEDGDIYTSADGSWKLKNNGNVDRLGVFLNATEDEYTDAVGKTGSWEKIINDGLHGSWDMLTKKEINAYYYLLNTEGYEAADKFLEDMTPELNRRTVEQTNENIKKAVENGNILENAALGAYSVISKPLGNMAAAADDALSLILEGEINPYSTAHELMNTANQIRGSQAEAIDKATGGAKIPILDYSAGEAYQAAMSTLDTMTSKFTGAGLYSAQMSAGAFSDKVTDLYLQGASKTEIASLGAIAAAAEYYFEKFSIDRLIHIGDSKTLSQILKNTLMQGGIEESEEMLTEATNIIADGIIRGGASEWNKLLEESDGNVLLALGKEVQQIGKAGFSGFISGMLAGGVASAGNYVQNQIETHQIGKKSDLKAIEGKLDGMIADPELDGDTKKLLEAVREDIKSGKIDTDKIEQIFGGDKYTVWKDADRKESELIEEYEKLADTPSMELSRNQQKRLDELEGQLENLRGKTESNRLYGELTGYVSEQLDNSKLKDSKLKDIYNDKVSRRTKFTADVSKYSSEAARRSIQNLIDTGYANNSKETHEFADNVAKLAERTGKVFSFVNDEQIREMGKAVEGRRVNGFVTEDGIAVNLDSRKAWEFVVGHEVTHVFEKLNSYTELHDALKEFAIQRGEWDSRLKELTELYEGQDADVEAELVADLVGEYLFGDTDFISSLAVKNQNVFQKIYAEIKHLLKTVTAGSKQARQLERAKYAFEKAMRESGKAKVEGTEYSLSGEVKNLIPANNVNKNEIAEAYGGDGDVKYSLSKDSDKSFGEVLNSIYNYDTVNLDKQIVDWNIKDFADKWDRGYYTSVVETVANHTGKDQKAVWDAFAGILMAKEGIAKADGRTYINVHELSEDNLRKAFELGGLAAPSIGIVDVDNPTTNYGNISLIFPDIFNPETVPTYYGDSYSQSFPPEARFTDRTMLEDALTYGFEGMEYGGILSQEEIGELISDLEQVYFYDERQRTSHEISENGFRNAEEFARDYSIKNIDGLRKLYNGVADQFDSYEAFLADFADKVFTQKRLYKSNTGNDLYDWDNRAYNFRDYTLDNAVEEMTANGDKDFKFALGEKVTDYNEMLSPGMRARLKAKDGFYEAKPQYGVSIGDASYAVVPDSTSADIVEMLEDEGVEVVKYSSEGDWQEKKRSRSEAVKGILERNPDIRYSLSSNVTESQQFIRWFGDWKKNSKNASKIVNEDGTPRIVYHQTDRDFSVFDNSTPVAGKNDSETPNGFFFKDNDHDIGLGGSKQMAVYLDMKKPLRFASREDANQWYCQNISGYASLQNEMNEALSPISTEMDNIENEMFSDEVTDEQYEILDQKWNELLDKMKSVENDFRGRLRKLLDDYFINGSSGYDGIILDYDGHRYVNGVREDVKTYIVFKRTQIKSATDNIGTYDGSNPDINYSLSYENEADANADKRLNNADDTVPVREDAARVQDADRTPPVREDAQTANASEAAEDVPITTVRKRLETKKGNYERELESNRANRKQAWDNYDDAIAQAQSEYDGLKNKNTKRANNLLRRIDRYMRQQKNVDADYAKRISDIESRIGRTSEKIELNEQRKAQLASDIASLNMPTQERKSSDKIAKSLTKESGVNQKKKQRGILSLVKEYVLDNGMVFEDESKKHHNRQLEADWNMIRNARSMAQRFLKKSVNGRRSIVDIEAEVRKKGLTQDFYDYMHHMLNVDRMSLESKAQAKIADIIANNPVLGTLLSRNQSTGDILNDPLFKQNADTLKADVDKILKLKETKNHPVFGDPITSEISAEEAAKLEKAHPEFKSYAEEIYANNRELRDMLVEEGIITPETAQLWEEMYPHYVPLRRAKKRNGSGKYGRRQGVNAPLKRAEGGNSDIEPLFNSIALRAEQTYKAVLKNRFGVELMNTIQTPIVEADNKLGGKIDTPEGVENIDSLLMPGDGENAPTFTVFENGERVTFEITEEMYDAMRPTGDALSYTSKGLQAVSNLMRSLLTEYNLPFMVGNGIKDAQDILMNSQHPARTYAAIPKAIAQIASKGKYLTEYMDYGGQSLSFFDKQKMEFVKKNVPKEVFMTLTGLNAISKANNVVELMPRLAEYIASREAGRSIEISMLDAARVTTNFAAGGKLTKLLNRNGATFLNASVQGFMQNVRNIREAKMNGFKGWAGLAARTILAGVPALILNNLIWDDDDEYEELSDYIKQNYYIVGKFGDGKFVRIPKGRTVAVIQDAFMQMSNAITGDDEVDFESFAQLVINNLVPNNPYEDNVASPIVKMMMNETWYGGDLVPTRLQDSPKAEQYDETTDAISKWLGEKLNFSPYKINYLLDQYTGGIGDILLPMITPESETGDDSVMDYVTAPFRDKFTTDSVLKNQNVSDFYDLKDELNVNANSSKATDDDVLKNKYMNSMSDRISELQKQKREIQARNDLSKSEKYEMTRNLQKEIVALTKEAIDSYENLNQVDGNHTEIGGYYYEWYTPEEGEPYWRKMTDSQKTKYLLTKDADGHYVTDGNVHYRLDEDGEWTKISDKDLARQNEVTKELGITPDEYWSKTETSFFPVKNGEYEYAYENPEKYTVAKAVGGYDSYKSYSKELSGIKADKDETGKPISGSRKEKVLDYINGLDIDYGEKIILFKNEYNADDTYNYDIINYLNSRDDISYSEMETILKELGFDVDSEGNVSW